MKIGVKSVLLKTVSGSLEEHGFKYDQALSFPNVWTYSRDQGGDLQEFIRFDKSQIEENAVRFFLDTTKDRVGMTGRFLAGQEGTWWYYEDKASLENAFREMLEVILEKGLEWFVISSTPMLVPSEEMDRKLLADPTALSDMFQEQHHITINGIVGLEALESLIQDNKKSSTEIDWAFLLGASAYFGETLRTSFGGNWGWDPDFGEPCVMQLGDHPFTKEHLLYRVLRFRTNPYMRLTNHYLYLQNAMQMPHIYQPRKKIAKPTT